MALERIKPEFITRFVGKVEDVRLENSSNPDIQQKQFHIEMKPDDEGLLKNSKTQAFHEWIRLGETTDPDGTTISEGSVADRFLAELELCDSDVKNATSVKGAFESMKGKSYEFVRKKLGKSYKNFEAKDYWTPVSLKE